MSETYMKLQQISEKDERPNIKMDEDMTRQFPQEVQINKYVKRCSTSLITRRVLIYINENAEKRET